MGGKNRLPMADLRAHLADAGFEGVQTYIQSGNVVCRHPAKRPSMLVQRMGDTIETHFGFRPAIHVLTLEALQAAADASPFTGENLDKALHLFFLDQEPRQPDLEGLKAIKGPTEDFSLSGKVFYLHAPDGIGRSKLAQRAERLLGVPATARNWRTVQAVLSLANAL